MPSEQRLHPSSVLFSFGKSLRRLALPGLVVLIAGRSASPSRGFGPFGSSSDLEVWAMLLLVPAGLLALGKYLSFRLRYEGTELVMRSGIIFRNERHVPYSRIQNLEGVQNVLHRLLGVTEVRVDTGAGAEPEATISVLPIAAFEEMRRRVLAGRVRTAAAPDATVPESAVPESRALLALPLRELLLLGIVDNRGLVIVGAVLGGLWQLGLLERAGDVLFGRFDWTGALVASIRGEGGSWSRRIVNVLAATAAILVLLRLFSAVWAVIRLYGFVLRRDGDDLRTEYGLFTRIAATVPVHRVQTLTIHQGPLQQLFGRCSLKVETAGGSHGAQEQAQERAWLAPIIRPEAVAALAREVVSEFDLETLMWEPVHPGAFRRVLKRTALLVTIAAVIAAFWLHWWVLPMWGPALALSVVNARRQVRHFGWAATDDVVAFRSGWLWRRVTVARAAKIQAVTLVESPFDRRSSMAGVRIDTAGAGVQSHRVAIPYLARGVADGLHARCAERATATAFRW